MRVAIVGVGAIGVSVARNLKSIGIEPIGFNQRAVDSFEIVLPRAREMLQMRVHGQIPEDLRGTFGLVIFCLKNHVIAKVLHEYLQLLADDGVVLCAQNGIMEYFISKSLAPSRLLGALVKGNAIAVGPNRVEIPKAVKLVVGPFDEELSPAARRALDLFAETPFSRTVPSVLPYKWTKLVFSCVVNPLSALTGLDADRLLRTAAALPAALEIISEVIQLANAEGVRLAREGPVSPYWLRRGNGVPAVVKKLILRAISFSLKNVKVSMLQDIENGRRTEIDFLNGFIVDRARGFGIETPRNELTTRLVKELESGALRPNTANLDRFRKRTELASPG